MGYVSGAIGTSGGIFVSGHVDAAPSEVELYNGGVQLGQLDISVAGLFEGEIVLNDTNGLLNSECYMLVFEQNVSDEAHYPVPDQPPGAMFTMWGECGGTAGFGYPRSFEKPAPDGGTTQSFDRGSITIAANGAPTFDVHTRHKVTIASALADSDNHHKLLGVRLPVTNQSVCDIYRGPASANQEWVVCAANGSGEWNIRSAQDPRYLLGVAVGLGQLPTNVGAGWAVDVYAGASGGPWQTWSLTPSSTSPQTLEPSWSWPPDSSKTTVLGVPSSRNVDTQQVDVFPPSSPPAANQKWIITYVG